MKYTKWAAISGVALFGQVVQADALCDNWGNWSYEEFRQATGATIFECIDAGADVDAPWPSFADDTLLQIFAGVFDAHWYISALLDRGANAGLYDANGFTALHLAVARNSARNVQALLDSGVYVDMRDAGGYTPLHNAVILELNEMVKILLREGAYVNASSSNSSGIRPLTIAVHMGDEKTAGLLRAAGGRE